MKKILLSCVTCLLALGLVTACEDEVEEVTPEDPSAGVVEPGDDDGGSTEKGEDFLPVLGTVTAGDYFLGIEVDSVPYYFDGEVLQSYYGEVSEHGYEAVTVTVAEVTGGYTLSFADSEEATKYIQMAESDGHHNFVWGDDPYVWSYDTTFDTFVALDSEGVYYYMGSYGSYKEMTLSRYSYLEEGASSYEQYPAHLYDVITYVAPTAITVTANGESSEATVEVGRRISLTATATGEGNVDPRVTWSSSAEDVATVSDSGSVLGVSTGSATITATSVLGSVSGTLTITVTEAITPLVTYKLGSCDERNLTYYWFNGSTTGSTYLATSTSWSDAVDIYIEAIDDDSIDNSCTLSFYDTSSNLKYISSEGKNTSLTLSESPCTWVWDATNEVFALGSVDSGRFIGQYSNGSLRGYAHSNLSDYPHAAPYTTEPTALTATQETPTLTEVTTISAGEYYLGSVDSNGTAHLIDGRAISNVLTTATDFSYAAKVTVAAGDNSTWTMSIGENQYIYATGSTSNLGIGAGTGTNNVKGFTWNATMCTLTYSITSTGTTTNYYLEFYNNNVTAYSFSNDSGNNNIAHLYQAVA